MDTVELDWLETFLAVVDQGGFTAASEHIHRSQSRVSAHIAGLERALGVQLIDRHRRPAALTDAGVVLSRHARAVLAELATARSAIDALRAVDDQHVTLLTTPWIGSAVLPQLLPALRAKCPSLQLSVIENRHLLPNAAEGSGAFSVAILPALDHPLPNGLHEHLLWRDRLRLVVPAGDALAADGGVVSTDRLGPRRVLLGAAVDPGRLNGISAVVGDAPVPTSTATLVELVRHGAGVGVESAVALGQVGTGGLAVVDLADDHVVDIAAYWYDSLPARPFGRAVIDAVLGLGAPAGGRAPGADH